MTITTPEFQGTHLWDRLCWAKEKLEPVRTEYCVVWEDPDDLDALKQSYTLIQIGWLVHYRVEYYHQFRYTGS